MFIVQHFIFTWLASFFHVNNYIIVWLSWINITLWIYSTHFHIQSQKKISIRNSTVSKILEIIISFNPASREILSIQTLKVKTLSSALWPLQTIQRNKLFYCSFTTWLINNDKHVNKRSKTTYSAVTAKNEPFNIS